MNLQRKLPLDLTGVRDFVSQLVEEVSEADGRYFDVAFISDRRMKELNRFFRGKDSTTDVLSFPHEADEFESNTPEGVTHTFLGDIVISVEQAERQANENGLSLDGEFKQLILHGLLHLSGYDHETDDGEMSARELELRDKLGL
jgi:probable rRNA maturation factor